jgi:hypothetical protein
MIIKKVGVQTLFTVDGVQMGESGGGGSFIYIGNLYMPKELIGKDTIISVTVTERNRNIENPAPLKSC